VAPDEAQGSLETDDDLVESVPMPPAVEAWVRAFVETHHVDEPVFKRQRQRTDPNAVGFGRPPPDRGSADR
jgi:hypothetical protein